MEKKMENDMETGQNCQYAHEHRHSRVGAARVDRPCDATTVASATEACRSFLLVH